MHTVCLYLHWMAAPLTQIYAESIGMMHDDFHLWYFCQKIRKTCVEAFWCTHMDCGMLDHWAPFLVLPIGLAVASNPVNGFAKVAGVKITCQVSVNREMYGASEWASS